MQTIKQMMAHLPARPAPENLKNRILARIAEAAERSARLHRVLFGAISLTSAVVMVPAVRFVILEFSQSTFASYFSLIFSDSGIALAHWREVVLTLAESAPVLGLTMTLAAAFVLLASVRAFARYAGSGHLSHAIS